MATYYCNMDSGNDTTGSGTSGSPWKTISKGVSASATGDTVVLQESTTAYLWADITSTTPRTIQATKYGDAIIEGAVGDCPEWTFQTSLTCTNLKFISHHLEGGSYTGDGTSFKNGDDANAITFTYNGCSFKDVGQRGLSNYGVWRVAGAGVVTVNLTGCLVIGKERNTGGFSWHLVSTGGSGTSHVFNATNSTFIMDDVTDFGAVFSMFSNKNSGSTATSFTLNSTNCIYYDGQFADLFSGVTMAFGTYDYNCAYSNSDAAGSGTGNITSDPLFVDTANADYRLRPSSPCRGTGSLI